MLMPCPNLEKNLRNMEKGHDQLVPSNGVEDSGDIDADGKEGGADGYSRGSNLHMEEEDDNKDDEKEEGESEEVDSSSSYES